MEPAWMPQPFQNGQWSFGQVLAATSNSQAAQRSSSVWSPLIPRILSRSYPLFYLHTAFVNQILTIGR